MFNKLVVQEQQQILEQLFKGRKVSAIKLYRQFSGLGLKDAKDEIEQIERDLRAKNPHRFVAQSESNGCLGMTIMLIVLLGLSYGAWRMVT